jgi:hypothetical protein
VLVLVLVLVPVLVLVLLRVLVLMQVLVLVLGLVVLQHVLVLVLVLHHVLRHVLVLMLALVLLLVLVLVMVPVQVSVLVLAVMVVVTKVVVLVVLVLVVRLWLLLLLLVLVLLLMLVLELVLVLVLKVVLVLVLGLVMLVPVLLLVLLHPLLPWMGPPLLLSSRVQPLLSRLPLVTAPSALMLSLRGVVLMETMVASSSPLPLCLLAPPTQRKMTKGLCVPSADLSSVRKRWKAPRVSTPFIGAASSNGSAGPILAPCAVLRSLPRPLAFVMVCRGLGLIWRQTLMRTTRSMVLGGRFPSKALLSSAPALAQTASGSYRRPLRPCPPPLRVSRPVPPSS